MAERVVSEQEIDDQLEKYLEIPDNKQFTELTHVIKFLALILFNLRKDYAELYNDYIILKDRILDVFNKQGMEKKSNEEVLEEKTENYDTKRLYL